MNYCATCGDPVPWAPHKAAGVYCSSHCAPTSGEWRYSEVRRKELIDEARAPRWYEEEYPDVSRTG